MKTCTKCGEEKPLESFSVDRGKPRRYCKACGVIATRKWSQNNPDKVDENKRRCYAKNKNRYYVAHKLRRENLSDSYCREVLKQKRGFTEDQITPELITAHRALIQLKRAIKETV